MALPPSEAVRGLPPGGLPRSRDRRRALNERLGNTTYGDGARVQQSDRISQDLAEALLAGRLERDCHLLAQRIPGWQELGVNQQAALLSFSYNCGPSWFGSPGFSTLTSRLQAGELELVPASLML